MGRITNTGNLAAAPEVKQDRNGKKYARVAVIVNDQRRNPDTGEWERLRGVRYNLRVFGLAALDLAASAEVTGNIRIVFSGEYTEHEYETDDGTKRVAREVTISNNDHIGVALGGQRVGDVHTSRTADYDIPGGYGEPIPTIPEVGQATE